MRIIILTLLLLTTVAHAADSRPGQLKVVTYGPDPGQVTITTVNQFDFTASRFAPPPDNDTERQQRIKQAAAYIHTYNKSVDAVAVATDFVDGSSSFDPDYLWLALAVARYESSCNFGCRGYHFGAFQLDPPRVKSIRAIGADPADGKAQVEYFCRYVSQHVADGASLRQALKPWSVRSKALREYARLK